MWPVRGTARSRDHPTACGPAVRAPSSPVHGTYGGLRKMTATTVSMSHDDRHAVRVTHASLVVHAVTGKRAAGRARAKATRSSPSTSRQRRTCCACRSPISTASVSPPRSRTSSAARSAGVERGARPSSLAPDALVARCSPGRPRGGTQMRWGVVTSALLARHARSAVPVAHPTVRSLLHRETGCRDGGTPSSAADRPPGLLALSLSVTQTS